MVFSSMVFLWVFLPILLFVYYLVPKRIRIQNFILLVFSLLFYAWGEPVNIIYMIIAIVINYSLGMIMDKCNNKSFRLLVLILAIIVDLGLLGYFKYYNFLAKNINSLLGRKVISLKSIVLPIGISFYTFQILSYMIDLYRKNINVQKNIFNLALYISFFPQLIAGPIVKYHDIEDQILKRKTTISNFAKGVRRFTYGLAKKVLLANSFALFVDNVYDVGFSNISTFIAWVTAICYMLQIYYDFSGYSDMAIGLGKMFGFEFMENFNIPYISTSITEFWRRWHISLSTWFKEYVYIPLGGNRRGKIRTYINLWLVFLATGIWHGASWNFVFWGLFHGFFIFIERLFLKKILDKHKRFGFIYTFFVVLIGWVFFRAPSLKSALKILKIMFSLNSVSYINIALSSDLKLIILIALGLVLSCIPRNKLKDRLNQSKIKCYGEPILVLILLVISILTLVSNTYNPFIYFRF